MKQLKLVNWQTEVCREVSPLHSWKVSRYEEPHLIHGWAPRLSSVLVTKQSLSPDGLKSSWTPSTLHKLLNSNSLFLDILHPNKENKASAQKSTCFDSLLLDRHRKSSKYTDHMRWRRADHTFHSARETRRKAVTEAIDPKGRTHRLKIFFAEKQPGSYTAK